MRNYRIGKSRTGLCVALVALVVMAVGASAASAAEPWWHVNTVSAPASQPGGEGRLELEVTNLGDAAVNGSANPVTIVDQLPAGVTPTHVYGEGGGSFTVGVSGVKEFIHCSIASQTVTCTYDGPLLAYERFMIAITVSVESGAGDGVSEVSVSGGGATPVLLRHALALGNPLSYGVENYELTPEEEGGAPDTQAGSHPFQLTTTLTFNTKAAPIFDSLTKEVLPEVQPVALTKDLRFDLPPGLVGNPTPLPKCRLSVFLSAVEVCANDTVVGVATPLVTNPAFGLYVSFAPTTPLYSLEPAVGEPARFGFSTSVGPVILDTSVRTGEGYGVVVSVPDILDEIAFIGSQVTFWGVPADPRHDTTRGSCLDVFEGNGIQKITNLEVSCPVQERPQPFLIMPTSCGGPLHTSVSGDSWETIGQYTAPKEYTFANLAGEPFGEDGCNQLSFEPSIKVAPDGQSAATPTGLSVDVHVGQEASLNPSGDADAQVKNTTVALPAGVGLNPSGADGLQACPMLTGTEPSKEAQEEKHEVTGINLGTKQPANCPEASKVATVAIHTPLLPNPLEGAAYLATPAPSGEAGMNPFDSLIAMYIVAYDPVSGVLVKLAGEVTPNPVTGQLVATFKETPQLPFEDLVLHFFGGSRAPLGTPSLCGGYSTVASIAPWSGNSPAESSSEFQITSGPEIEGAFGPEKTPCADPLPFAPSLTTGSSNIQAGAFTPFTMTMSREDGSQNLQAIQLKMPPGLSGLLSGVKLCGEAAGNAGTCGPESLIGETTVSVGLGGNPYTVTGGKVYITGPYKGAPFGLSIVNPANAGPFHLGNVIVRAKIEVDPTTAALTITSDNEGPYKIPQYIDGIPLQIKHVNVTISRPNFTFNPTSCNKMEIGGSLHSTEGSTKALAVPFQATNCASLKFEPKFAVSTQGKTSKANGASLSVKLTYPNAPSGTQANIKQVKVELPKQLPSRLTTLQKACLAATFEANHAACPATSVIGTAKAITPLLPVPLEGPIYFVSHASEAFPSLEIVLQGYGVEIVLTGETFISKAGITSSTFHTVPDQPVTSFELTLPEKPYSALAAIGNLCHTTKTVTVKKRVVLRRRGHVVRRHGKVVHVRRKVKKTKPASLTMPTEFLAQNGAAIHKTTKISVTGCPKAHTTKAKKKVKRKRQAKKKARK